MAAITGTGIGLKICEATGIDPKDVTNINLNIPVNDVVLITVTRHICEEHVEGIKEVIQQYQLHEVKEEGK